MRVSNVIGIKNKNSRRLNKTFIDYYFENIKKGMILILRVTPLAQKDVEKLRKVIEELYVIARNAGADIARLGEERIIVTPTNVKIWKPDYDLK